MRKSFVTLLLLLGAAASLTGVALAGSDDLSGDLSNKLVTPRKPGEGAAGSRALRRVGPSKALTAPYDPDTLWIGHSVFTADGTQGHANFGPYHVGVGRNWPNLAVSDPNYDAGRSGVWRWEIGDAQSGETDSLFGWRPMIRAYGITGGLTLTDDQRPWWATDDGNLGNYVLNSASGRTIGVVSYWHVDGGNTANPGPFNGNALPAMTWAPLVGTKSAWCGLRAHGDFTYQDPITKNYYNQAVLEMVGENGAGSGTSKSFPGYPGQMDQMLYRDAVITTGASLNLSFSYDTRMSKSAGSTAATRTGWFAYDPTIVGNVAVAGPNSGAPNFISNTGIGQPADSFMVYIGVPVDIDNVYTADGNLHTAGLTPHGVYDLKRRWLSEVLALDKPITQLLSTSGNTGTDNSGSFTVTGQSLAAILAAQTTGTKYVRIVFRVKTNIGFDDLAGSNTGAYNSGGAGAVRIDAVSVGGTGVSGSVTTGVNGFENVTDIDNADGVDPGHALAAWRATGKPPAIYFHTHPLAGGNIGGGNIYSALTYQDLCGPPSATARFCNMNGVVISAGDHDNSEKAGGGVAGAYDREREDGILSPTINLAVQEGQPTLFNGCGVSSDFANPADDYWIWYDIYTGVFDLNFTGNAWSYAFQSYPANQANGVKCWGELRFPTFQIFNPDRQCLQDIEPGRQLGLILHSSPNGHPDSLRIFLGKNQQCFRFGVTGSSCSPTTGAYFDDVALGLSNASASGGGGSGAFIAVDIWRWINDAFPANDNTSSSPGVAVAPGTAGFDTAAAYIQTGINIAQATGNSSRFDIAGDSVIVIGGDNDLGPARLDMIFRIKPGVGNYVTVGNSASGLRRIPTSTVAATNNDGSFWGTYMAHRGPYGAGSHPVNGWDISTWNSARCDTADVHVFRAPSSFNTITTYNNTAQWAATYHEGGDALDVSGDDALKFATLGIAHPRCFLTVPTGANNSTNITCTGSPAVPANYPPASGWDGNPVIDKEGTKIIPDGLLTPGAHVEYFFRAESEGPPITTVICPDTTIVNPQTLEGSTDAHRWQQFGILPDRWKNNLFSDPSGVNGTGMACMLYVDLNDRRGNERVWVSVSDSIGATAANKRGAHNGWTARGDQHYTDPLTGTALCITCGDPTVGTPVAKHIGQPGSTWDMYGVKASESLTTSAGALGNRAGVQATGLALGKDAKMGPTPDMLRTYYRAVMILSGDLNSGVLGKFINRGQNDVVLLQDYLSISAPTGSTPRAIFVSGDGFVQSEWATGGPFPEHRDLLTNYLGVSIKRDGGGVEQPSYQPWSGNVNPYVDLITAGPIAGDVYSVGNACLWGNDVLNVEVNATGAVASGFYQNFGTHGPYVSGVYTPINNGAGKFYASYVDGFDIEHLFSRYGGSSLGRLGYYFKLLTNLQTSLGCTLVGTPAVTLDVPGNENGGQFVDFLQVRNNPLVTGQATVHFGLSRADRVQVRVYDVTGRLVRTLADRTFRAGEHDLVWDGTDDAGRQMSRGVYFTQVRYAATKFTDAKKLTVLK